MYAIIRIGVENQSLRDMKSTLLKPSKMVFVSSKHNCYDMLGRLFSRLHNRGVKIEYNDLMKTMSIECYDDSVYEKIEWQVVKMPLYTYRTTH